METKLAKVSQGKNGPRFCCQRTQETEQGRLMEKLYENGVTQFHRSGVSPRKDHPGEEKGPGAPQEEDQASPVDSTA